MGIGKYYLRYVPEVGHSHRPSGVTIAPEIVRQDVGFVVGSMLEKMWSETSLRAKTRCAEVLDIRRLPHDCPRFRYCSASRQGDWHWTPC